MALCCRFCGAEHSGVNARCPDCGLAPEASVPTLAPGRPEEEVVYEVADWPAHARVVLGTTLSDRGIPWRWDRGLELVVRETDDEAVEELLDELEDEALEEIDPETEAAEEDAHEAMGDLFVAADRLMHEPWDESAAEDLLDAAGVVEASVPPYGMAAETWVRIQEMAKTVRTDLDTAGEEVVAQDARALREVLRRYV